MYYYKITATNSVGEGMPASTGNVPTYIRPGPVSDFEVIPGDGEVYLTWEPPAFDGGLAISNYYI